MKLYRIEIKQAGIVLKVVAARGHNALAAINIVSRAYPVGPFEFKAILVPA